MIRLLIYFFIFYFLFSLFKKIVGGVARGSGEERAGGEGEMMVLDPNCGTYIPKKEALTKKINGETIYFCSKECLNTYLEGPKA